MNRNKSPKEVQKEVIRRQIQAAVKHQAKRTVTVAEWIKKSNQ
nr:hypothetical protein [Neobacillus drentensis]